MLIKDGQHHVVRSILRLDSWIVRIVKFLIDIITNVCFHQFITRGYLLMRQPYLCGTKPLSASKPLAHDLKYDPLAERGLVPHK